MSLFDDVNTKNFFLLLQSQLIPDSMTKKGKKKAKIIDYDSNAEISPVPRMEIIYEYTKSDTRDEPKFKWGQTYLAL